MAEYAYSMLVRTFGVKPEITDMTADQISQNLALAIDKLLKEVADSLPKLPPGDWEMLSHSITRIGGGLSVTFLLRREKKASD
jgi:hypothetical protein